MRDIRDNCLAQKYSFGVALNSLENINEGFLYSAKYSLEPRAAIAVTTIKKLLI